METAEIKKLLTQSKKEPVNCAVGVTKDGLAQVLLHKTKNPRALLKELEADAGKLATPAFGSAFVDVDEDPKLVILTLNKAPSGISKRLKKAMGGTGFTKVEIRNEDGTVAEQVAGDEEGAAGSGEGAAPAEAEAAAPAEAEAGAPDLKATLGGLMKRIPGAIAANPAASDELKRLAGVAVGAVKVQDEEAAQAVAALQQAVEAAEKAAGGQNPAVDLKALQAELGQLIKQIQTVAAANPERLDGLKTLAATAAAAVRSPDAAAAAQAVAALR
ncbi:MAG TPA: hypothetical protein VE650_00730, partial [Acetobacteraceae bacterium]|nr:hypothetical protein [Acetobacteraceae bacterium]